MILIPIQNKSQKFSNNLIQDKSSKLRHYMDSRSSLRQVWEFMKHNHLKFLMCIVYVYMFLMFAFKSCNQGALAKRRSNFQGNQFPVAAEIARKAVNTPLRNRNSNRNRVASWNKARYCILFNYYMHLC